MFGWFDRKEKQRVVVHIGFPKCASTTIQYNFLAKQQEALFVSRKGNAGDPRYWQLYELLSKAITRGKRRRAARKAWLKAQTENADKSISIFSDERITLPKRHCGYSGMLDRPAHVKQIFHNARILLVLRHPYEYLRSLYQQQGLNEFKKRRTLPPPFTDWLDLDPVAAKHKRGSVCQGLYFAEIALRYGEFFGQTNVGVFFLEDLQSDSGKFFSEIADFIGLCDAAIPSPALEDIRNATAEKTMMAKIVRQAPYFAEPVLPDSFRMQARPLLREQAHLLRQDLGIDVFQRWPELTL